MISGKDICAVIPTAGERTEALFRAVDSVLEQSEICGEIIVVWDSDSNSPPGLEKGGKVKVIRNTSRTKGVAGARNSAILETQLTYIALLDDDDYWLPQKIGEYIKAINANKEVSFYISRGKFVEPSGHNLGVFPSKRFREGVTLANYLNSNFFIRRRRVSIPTSSYVFPRRGPKGLNLFDEEIFLAEDLLLLLQLDQNMPFQLVGNEALCVTTIYKDSKEGLSRRSIDFDEWFEIQHSYFSFLGTRQFANSTLYFGIRHFRASYNLLSTLRWYLTNIWKDVDLATILSTGGWLVANEFTTLYRAIFRSRSKKYSAKFSVDR